ncbi:hypothetical protein Poli38472_009087 [Pythium oligandrum]|uniref:B box-type domain-containing protein n=1 Tax=Pythium oligandrum TaxID=41045 RepID=A0A8K1FIF2_PYTOL|nr:hypothetical protein Poli38472_009087 [Pythium oligandrum]|eukprot:TMW64920.1 hypothetical protein Poli38472_009087 [Pythium oligandrum]
MVAENEENGSLEGSEMSASLARLRLFLAPHAGSKLDADGGPDHSVAQDGSCRDTKDSVAHEDTEDRPNDSEPLEDLSADLNVLAEQLGESTDESDHLRPESDGADPKPHEGFSHNEPDITNAVPAVGAVATVSPLSTASSEFARTRHLLQCCLPGYRVHDDMVMWDMKNPALMAQYEEHASGLLELESWVAVDDLSAAMGETHSYAFTQVNDGHSAMKFTTGDIQIESSGATGSKVRKQLVLCKIAVGRSVVVEREGEAQQKPLPSGYHSYYIRRSHDPNPPHGYCHEYILTNALQILPQFLVRFSVSAIDNPSASSCALCEKHSATVSCKSCEADLCQKCDQDVHSANKLVSRHQRMPLRHQEPTSESRNTRRRSSTPLTAGASMETNQTAIESRESSDIDVSATVAKLLENALTESQSGCPSHSDKKVEFYCSVCCVPVCVNCKMIGDHSVGEKGAHRLLSITDAYERSLRESLKTDPLIESRMTVIDSKLKAIEKCKKDVETNREQVEAAIREQYENALARLKDEVQKKIDILDGEALEYRRQSEHIDWLDDSLDEIRSSCSVVDFLSAWKEHKVLRTEQRDFPTASFTSSGDRVKGDLQLLGRLQVIQGDRFDAQAVTPLVEDQLKSSNDGGNKPPMSTRRTSDSEIRRKLLSMRSLPSSTASTTAPSAASMTLSAKGVKMIEEIRRELLSPGRPGSSLTSPNGKSPLSNSTATLRQFSINPVRKKSASASPDEYQVDPWLTLLRRHELTRPPASTSS